MIREPAVADQFYSGHPKTLRDEIQSFVQEPEKKIHARAIVAPHAGYMYSGAVAGAVYGAVHLPRRYIVLGPNHTGRGVSLSIYPEGQWRTPLGLASIDAELSEQLVRECAPLRKDEIAHAREHSLEVQIPFLQVLVPDFRFAAICIATGDYDRLEDLGHALSRVVKSSPEPVLLISSSDMNHFESATVAAVKDGFAIERILAGDAKGLHSVVRDKDISMCGIAPTVAILTACRDLGSSRGHLIRYANSGDVSGNQDRVVGYAGLAVV